MATHRVALMLSAVSSALWMMTAPVHAQSAAAGAVSFHLAETDVPVEPWGAPDGQMRPVRGRLEVSGQPVAGAELSYGAATCRTGADGSFTLQIPTGDLAQLSVRVASLKGATVNGRPVPAGVRARLLSASTAVRVDFPITLQKPVLSGDGRTVTVHGQVRAPASIPLSFQLDRYALQGYVYGPNGKPVQGAVVSVTTDGGEGWAKSSPTGSDGFYRLKFIPESDEDASFRVSVGSKEYVLPPNKVFHFPENTSSEVDVTLPKTGNVIVDRPPTLVAHTIPGAYYQGVAVGIAAPPGVRCTATAPDKDGSFTATLPASLWRKGPVWFESNVDAFFAHPVRPGQVLPQSVLKPRPGDPVGIRPR